MSNKELVFKINDWHQLKDCQSNNSTHTRIVVSDFINDRRLSGTRISLIHDEFGVLFSCIVNASGGMVSEIDDNIIFELTPKQILSELHKYGYNIIYTGKLSLPGSQLEYLMTIRKLKFDKLRILNVYEYDNKTNDKLFKWYVVAFNVDKNVFWLNADYSPSKKEFFQSIDNGSAINISALTKEHHWNWSWLAGYIADIDDILEENSGQ